MTGSLSTNAFGLTQHYDTGRVTKLVHLTDDIVVICVEILVDCFRLLMLNYEIAIYLFRTCKKSRYDVRKKV